MRRKIGAILIIMGCGLVAAALALFLSNQREQQQAAAAAQDAIVKVVNEIIREQDEEEKKAPTEIVTPIERRMTVKAVDGYDYIGFLSIPALELELPVMADWTYGQLQIAPCRYTGDAYTDNLVIMAHNYPKHFGKLRDLNNGDVVTITDMDGNTNEYKVVAMEILPGDAVADMTSGSYDLTLFTCTYGGENRVALRCDRQRE